MAVGAGHAAQALGVDRMQAHAQAFGQADEVLHAPVAAGGFDVDIRHALGILPQARGHGVEADQEFLFSHGRDCTRPRAVPAQGGDGVWP
ncbi:hypothetical protein D3C72_2287100 [compost metagenome]